MRTFAIVAYPRQPALAILLVVIFVILAIIVLAVVRMAPAPTVPEFAPMVAPSTWNTI